MINSLYYKIKVFVSSTFKDMEDERNHLTKVIKRAQSYAAWRNVELIAVDLRWGITDEDSRNGRVIPICLREIDDARPFFIGIVGNRYGWRPTLEDIQLFPHICDSFPQVEKYIQSNMSITEMEMRYGALDSVDAPKAVFFYKDNFTPECTRHQELLDTIKASPYPVTSYSSPEDLGDKIYKSLTRIIDELYLSDFEKDDEESYHRKNWNYKIHNYYKDEIAFADFRSTFREKRKIVVIGEEGIGKTAFVWRWLFENWNDKPIITSFDNYNYNSVISVLNKQLRDYYGISPAMVSVDESHARQEMIGLLDWVKSDGRECVIFLDAIQNLGTIREKGMYWLPEMPENVHIIITTRYNFALSQLGYSVFKAKPLPVSLVRLIIEDKLKKAGKKLEGNVIDDICNAGIFGNAEILISFLDEIIAFGSYEQLHKTIATYCKCDSYKEYYFKLMERLEEVFGLQIVKQTLAPICLCKYGLYQSEMLEVSQTDYLTWNDIYYWIKPYFLKLQTEGSTIREAVIEHYHLDQNNEYVIEIRKAIIRVLKTRNEFTDSTRLELLAQYDASGEIGETNALLMDLKLTYILLTSTPYLLRKYWMNVLKDEQYSFLDYITFCIEDEPYTLKLLARDLREFAADYLCRYEDAIEFAKIELEFSRSECGEESQEVSSLYNNLGLLYGELKEFDKARDYYQKSLDIKERLCFGDNTEKLITLQNIALTYYDEGEYEQAKDQLYAILFTYEENGYKDDVNIGGVYNSLGGCYDKLGDKEEALKYYLIGLDIRQKVDGMLSPDTLISYKNVSYTLERDLGDYAQAIPYLEKTLVIVRQLYGNESNETAEILESISNCYENLQDFVKAEKYISEAIKIQRSVVGGEQDLSYYLLRYGRICYLLRNRDAVLVLNAVQSLWECFIIRINLFSPDDERTIRAFELWHSIYSSCPRGELISEHFVDELWLQCQNSLKNLGDKHSGVIQLAKFLEILIINSSITSENALRVLYRKQLLHQIVYGGDSDWTYLDYFQLGEYYESQGCYLRALCCYINYYKNHTRLNPDLEKRDKYYFKKKQKKLMLKYWKKRVLKKLIHLFH